jgi:hypothetical protein
MLLGTDAAFASSMRYAATHEQAMAVFKARWSV